MKPGSAYAAAQGPFPGVDLRGRTVPRIDTGSISPLSLLAAMRRASLPALLLAVFLFATGIAGAQAGASEPGQNEARELF